MSKTLTAALAYRSLGYSVIPVGEDKVPLIQWTPYQSERATEARIRDWWGKWPDCNVGIVTGNLSGLAVIDLDLYRDPTALQALNDMISDSLTFPVALTPRGGQHWYFKCPPGLRNHQADEVIKGVDLRAEGGYVVAAPSSNGNGPYVWKEGHKLMYQVEPPAFPMQYIEALKHKQQLYKQPLTANPTLHNGQVTEVTRVTFEEGGRNDSLFRVANHMAKGGASRGDIYRTLVPLANSCIPPYPMSQLMTLVDSAMKRGENKGRHWTEEAREWVSVSGGVFNVTDLYRDLGAGFKEDRGSIRTALKRLCEKEVIEKVGGKNGQYRAKETAVSPIDLKAHAKKTGSLEYPIILPFELNPIVKIYPRNIMVVAGEKNTGKTTLCLKIADMNQDHLPVKYWTSEMGGEDDGAAELIDRIRDFDRPVEDWSVKFFDQAKDFGDVIDPDALNIVDFLQLEDKFYEVATFMRQIYDKLRSGVCFVAMQKDTGAIRGRGGDFSYEKSRLYLTLTKGHPYSFCGIGKLKSKRERKDADYDGMECEYSMVGGHDLVQRSPWYWPNKKKGGQ